jgi:[calcium/calmodulin-dependent protein kinase] kinase
VSDFGCAQRWHAGDRLTNTAGTFQFLAPECCTGEPFDPFLADIWAIGITLYAMFYGKLPFDATNTKE